MVLDIDQSLAKERAAYLFPSYKYAYNYGIALALYQMKIFIYY